jgi:hypothetical protein
MKIFIPLMALALAGNVVAAGAGRADGTIADARTALAGTASAVQRAADGPGKARMSPVALERRGGRIVGSRSYSLHFDEERPRTFASQAPR